MGARRVIAAGFMLEEVRRSLRKEWKKAHMTTPDYVNLECPLERTRDRSSGLLSGRDGSSEQEGPPFWKHPLKHIWNRSSRPEAEMVWVFLT